MTLTQLRFVVSVADHLHFGKAADACFVSQPTLSVAIKRLEESLNLVIFYRTNKQVEITAQGHEIIAQARLMLEMEQRIKVMAKNAVAWRSVDTVDSVVDRAALH